MRLPILYTMSWPARVACSEETWPRLDFSKASSLTFKAPDRAKYPALDLAYAAGRLGGTATAVLSAANEVAVAEFLAERIGYMEIVPLVEKVLGEGEGARDGGGGGEEGCCGCGGGLKAKCFFGLGLLPRLMLFSRNFSFESRRRIVKRERERQLRVFSQV